MGIMTYGSGGAELGEKFRMLSKHSSRRVNMKNGRVAALFAIQCASNSRATPMQKFCVAPIYSRPSARGSDSLLERTMATARNR